VARHFHVLVGLCGLYMPDDNVVCETRKEAEDAARSIAKQYRDDGERVSGSAKSGYYTVGENHCIEIADCDDAQCLDGDDRREQ
jgi:hypothetical protein